MLFTKSQKEGYEAVKDPIEGSGCKHITIDEREDTGKHFCLTGYSITQERCQVSTALPRQLDL